MKVVESTKNVTIIDNRPHKPTKESNRSLSSFKSNQKSHKFKNIMLMNHNESIQMLDQQEQSLDIYEDGPSRVSTKKVLIKNSATPRSMRSVLKNRQKEEERLRKSGYKFLQLKKKEQRPDRHHMIS